MAGFTMQVQSAISPFVCTLESGQPLYCLICRTPPRRACPYAGNNSYGEPNTLNMKIKRKKRKQK